VQVCHAAKVAVSDDVGYENLTFLELGSSDELQNVFRSWVKCVKSRRLFDSRDDIFNPEEEVLQFGI
jgi:hypothetical protein